MARIRKPKGASARVETLDSLLSEDHGHLELAWGRVAWLYALLGVSTLIWAYPPTAGAWLAAFALLLPTLCAGHSVGLHRGIIHRTYASSRWLRCTLAYLFVHTGIGGPVSWIRLHYVRDHYQNSAACPRYFRYEHTLFEDYFWNLHLRFAPRDPPLYGVPQSDEQDPWLRFLEHTWPLHVVALGAILWAGFGPGVALACVPVRVCASILGHWYIGFMAHKRGMRRYALDGSSESGTNLLLLGVLSFGEGFHNNHHANPGSARMGEAWYEIDLGWWLLLALERVGLIQDLKATGRTEGVRRINARLLATTSTSSGA